MIEKKNGGKPKQPFEMMDSLDSLYKNIFVHMQNEQQSKHNVHQSVLTFQRKKKTGTKHTRSTVMI